MALEIELVATGDELTRGASTDTNSTWLAERLAFIGGRVRRATVVGDVADDIRAALREASSRADFVICCGGMGPTSDDLTVACAADVAGAELVLHQPTLDRIRAAWARRNRPMPPAVEKQAMVPVGAEVLKNDEGTAPGLRLHIGKAECFFFAGVPREYKHLCERHLLPRVAAVSNRAIVTRTLRFVGTPESELDAVLLDMATDAGVRFGLRAKYPETWVSFTAERETGAAAERVLDPLIELAIEKMGDRCYSADDETLAEVAGKLLVQSGWTLSVAESCTGGLLGGELTAIPGSTRYFRGGVIAYANEEKTRALGVPAELIAREGAVSEAVARKMAEGAVERLGTTAALAVTGVAGPGGGTEEKPVGTVWIALASPRGTVAEKLKLILRDRDSIRRASVSAALDLLRRTLESRG